MFVTLAIICICFFILSFSLLFRKQLGKFFSFFSSLFKKHNEKNKKDKENRLKASTKQVAPKMISGDGVKKIDAPALKTDDSTLLKKDVVAPLKTNVVAPLKTDGSTLLKTNAVSPYKKDENRFFLKNSSEHASVTTENKDNENQEKDVTRKYDFSFKTSQKNQKLVKERNELDEEIGKISKMIGEMEKEKDVENKKMFDVQKGLPNFITNRMKEDEKTILGRRKSSDFMNLVKNKKSTEIEIDNELIDLSKLPANIKKLLISGILDRKDF